MISKLFSTLLITNLMIGNLLSNPAGEQVYQQLCSACHGKNGEGAGDGAFPPLAGSEWIQGDPNRIAQIILHGLTGPIEVKEKAFNLMMPPQGNLSEQQSVDVINYVVGKWGDEKKAFTLDAFKKASEKSADRAEPWTADELLKLYPLPGQKNQTGHIVNLIMSTYHGNWKKMPDFSTLDSDAVEEEHDGFLSLEKINRKKHFGLVWEGELDIEKLGTYIFEIEADDAAKLVINGKKIAEVTGLGKMNKKRKRSGEAILKKGLNDFRFEYLQHESNLGIRAKYREKTSKQWNWLSKAQKTKKVTSFPEIDLTPIDNRVRIYNNFIEGSSARGIAVGFPEGNHYAFSTDTATLDLLWSGKFISAGRHWTHRGQGYQAPSEKTLHSLSEKKPSWMVNNKTANIDYKGYKLAPNGNPTFNYNVNGVAVTDTFTPTSSGFTRSITFIATPAESTTLTLAENFSGSLSESTAKVTSDFSIIRSKSEGTLSKKSKKLILSNISSTPSTYTIEYQWKK